MIALELSTEARATSAVESVRNCSSSCAATCCAKLFRGRNQDGTGRDVVFRLSEHVGSDNLRVAFRSEDQDLGRAGHKINADVPCQQFLCLRNIGVAWTDNPVDSRDRLRPKCHGGDRLRSTHPIHFVRSRACEHSQEFRATASAK